MNSDCSISKSLRSKNAKGLIFGYLNINSIRNKFDFIKPVAKSFDLLTIAETKIDESFPTSQFIIDGFMRPFRRDRNKNGGGLLVYARDGAPIRQLSSYNFPDDIEAIVIEINLRKQKWLVISAYRPPSQCPKYFFGEIEKGMDIFSSKYENFIIIGDFNCEVSESVISDFMDSYNLYNLIKDPTCFKSDNPRCIDLILTNRKHNFQNTTTTETGLSDFHAMVVSMLKGGFSKRGPRIITYRDYSAYRTVDFRSDLMANIRSVSLDHENYGAFDGMVTDVLLQHAPIKKKYLRANDGPFMTKELRKEMMHRKRFLNKYNKAKTAENLAAYKRQRNKCVKILRKAKYNYYQNLDLKNLTDNRKFWKTVKPVFTDKVQVSQTITLIENGEMVTNDHKIAEIFNDYFVNITQDLEITENGAYLLPTIRIEDPVDKAVEKYKNHPSIKKIKECFTYSESFNFKQVTVEEVFCQLEKLNPRKSSPIGSIPAKVIKENSDIFAPVLQNHFNVSVSQNDFPEVLKAGDITSLYKKDDNFIKKNYRPITVLPATSKVYERLMESQMKAYARCFLNALLCGFRENYSTQHALLRFLENCRKALDSGNTAGPCLWTFQKPSTA